MKRLESNIVCEIAEQLMDTHGSTTTLDVKNTLRQAGYQATQQEVSQYMNNLSHRQGWKFQTKNQYRTYFPAPDTHQTFKAYLENDSQFWEVEVHGKNMIVGEGIIGEDGKFQVKSFTTNRSAIHEAKKRSQTQKDKGYELTTDHSLPLHIRQKYQEVISLPASAITVGYFSIQKTEKHQVSYVLDEQLKHQELEKISQMGCELSWNLAGRKNVMEEILQQKQWTNSQYDFDSLKPLGEKLVQQNLPSDIKNLQEQAQGTTSFVITNKHIFKIDFVFENGKKASLSKFDMDFETEMLPTALKILQN